MLKKKIVLDSLYNIIATIIPIAILQIFILPVIARKLGDSQYGLIVTLTSLTGLFSHPFGNVLNNIRLLQNKDYEEKEIQGDFNILLIMGLLTNLFLMIIGTIYYEGKFLFINIGFIVLISGINLLREYHIVAFRLSLNYKAILINNIVLTVGYMVGFLLFFITRYWQFVYACGYLFSLIYITSNSRLLREKTKKTIFFKKTSYKVLVLFISTFMGTTITYADKLLIYPLLGPNAVAVYYSASIIGKIVSMAITPVNGVFLSYLAKIETIKTKDFIRLIIFTGITGLVGYILCIVISNPILNLLYPDWANESMELVAITTASAIVGMMASVINPLILRFYNINWQFVISGVSLVVYIIFTIIFYNLFGLIGFCIGVLFVNVIKLIIIVTIYAINLYKKNKF